MKSLLCAICISVCAFGPGDLFGQKAGTAKPKTDQSQPRKESQATEPAMPVLPDIRNDPDVKEADIAIIANITAKELRFDVVPNSTVEFPGKPKSETIWTAERYNLPDKVEPGVTYRNIGIRLKITSRFADIDRIVAEALGEVPVSDDTKKPESQSTPGPSRSNDVTPPPAKKPARPRS